jgi:mannose-1-phosphate guanylyltransferase
LKSHQRRRPEYFAKGYKWNSGLLVARVDVLIRALSKFAPAAIEACRRALEDSEALNGEMLLNAQALSASPSISFDYVVLEHHGRVAVVDLDAEWTDVGNWLEFAKMYPVDSQSNRSTGQVQLEHCENTFVYSPERRRLPWGFGIR